MVDLSTKYMGLELKNPIIVGSSSLTGNLQKIKKCEEAGAGAIVLKSIFEEQILSETHQLEQSSETGYHVEAWEYLERIGRDLSINKYLDLIDEAKKEVSIPVIASLHCVSSGEWVEYAKKIEKAGADALELNVYILPDNPKITGEKIEKQYFDIIEKLKGKISIPVALKIGPYFSNLLHFATQLSWRKIGALVLFNRYYPFDIDIDKIDLTAGEIYSCHHEISTPLRWMTLLYDNIDCDLAATSGIHDGKAAIKQILAGATAIQIVSVLYKERIEYIGKIKEDIENWMEEKGFESLDDFRGKLSKKNSQYPELYDRMQFIKSIVGIS